MKTTACRYILFSAMLMSMSLNANQDGSSQSLLFHQSLSQHIQSIDREPASRQSQGDSIFYLVNDTSSYSGDKLILSRTNYQTTRNGIESSGRYFVVGNLLVLWDRLQRDFEFISVAAVDVGIWKACWASTPGSARACDSTADLVYIFASESSASSFQGNEQTDAEEPLAMGPDSTSDSQNESETDNTTPTEDTGSAASEPTESEPVAEPVQADPDPIPEVPEVETEQQEPEEQPSQVDTPGSDEAGESSTDDSFATEEAVQADPDVEPNPVESDDMDPPVSAEDTDSATSEEPQTVGNIESVVCGAPTEELRAALLQATNDSRSEGRSCGTNSYPAASELVWNDSLARAAQRHSNDMSSNNFFSHTGSDGLQVWDRANAENYQYRYIGENIAAGQRTVGQAQEGWINSPGHCANIMNEQIVEMGAACVEDSGSDYGIYWTVVVGESQ